jgi:hypothetical protein
VNVFERKGDKQFLEGQMNIKADEDKGRYN